MTEVNAEAKILNPKEYPEILDDTLNFVWPNRTGHDKSMTMKKMLSVFGKNRLQRFRIFPIKHHFNGYFLVFQISLTEKTEKV